MTSRTNEPHVQAVLPKLAQRNAAVSVFDPREYPQKAQIHARFGARGLSSARLCMQTSELELTELSCLWWRKPGKPGALSQLAHDSERAWAQTQAQTFLDGLYGELTCRWVPGPRSAAEVADRKPHQLAVAARLNLTVPDTLISNVPSDLLRFYEEHQGQIVMPWARGATVQRVCVRAAGRLATRPSRARARQRWLLARAGNAACPRRARCRDARGGRCACDRGLHRRRTSEGSRTLALALSPRA